MRWCRRRTSEWLTLLFKSGQRERVGGRMKTFPRAVIRSLNIPTRGPRKVAPAVAGAAAEGGGGIRGGIDLTVKRGGGGARA